MWKYEYYQLQKNLIQARAEVEYQKLELKFLEKQAVTTERQQLLIKKQKVIIEMAEFEVRNLLKLLEENSQT